MLNLKSCSFDYDCREMVRSKIYVANTRSCRVVTRVTVENYCNLKFFFYGASDT